MARAVVSDRGGNIWRACHRRPGPALSPPPAAALLPPTGPAARLHLLSRQGRATAQIIAF